MKFALFQVHSLDFLIRHLATGRVFPAIQTAGHLESFGGRRASDQIYDRLIIPKAKFGIRGKSGHSVIGWVARARFVISPTIPRLARPAILL
jgi:hypothetical protein